ncbi:PucR family transcriptional regulator [Brachybacterium sp. GCM10030267]|uniref:PucR family transcriptional regulator n=1 Tax=unclassified Brachybacterium TaxID=2623841 RepID=UPI003620F3B9
MNALDLAGLLAEPDNGGAVHVAGPAVAEWQRAEIAQAADELRPGGGRLAIITHPLPRESWRVDALLRRVCDRGYSGLALPGAEEIDESSRRLADRLDLVVLAAREPFVLAEATWRISEARGALSLDRVGRLATAFRYPARDLRDLLAHLSASAGCGIALLDADGVLEEAGGTLGRASEAIDWKPWTDVQVTDGMAVASVRVDRASRAGLRLAFFAPGVNQAQRSAMAVAAQVAMPAVAARILIDEIDAVSDASASAELLRDFLDRAEGDPGDVARRMAERGWRTSGYHLGFRVVGRSRVITSDLLRRSIAALGELEIESHVTTMGQGVTGWLRFPTRPAPAEVDHQVRALRAVHGQLRSTFNVATGVGSLRAEEPGLELTLRDATEAALLAADREASEWFVRFDAFGIEQLLLARTESDTFVPAAEALLAPLREGDDQLVDTLHAYLEHESNIAATAAALGLHRNTVTSRMRRIESLIGADLHDPSSRLALHLACRAVAR